MEDNKTENRTENKEGETKVSPLSLHNIYRNINISVESLDKIIICLFAALVLVLIIGVLNRGFVVEFDSQGGTYIESQKHLHGETIDYFEPERDGYEFTGWALDTGCKLMWDKDREVIESVKLYGCWK